MSTVKNYYYIALLIAAILFPGISQGAYLLNAEFGESGITLTGFDNYDDQAYAMVLQEDDKIIVAGQSDNGSDTDIAVIRYNSDGTLDTTFNSDGKATFKVGSGNDGAYGVAVLEDGSIVVAGYTYEEDKKNIALIRLTSSGYVDLDFGIAGQTILKMDVGDSEARDVIVDTNKNILVGGTMQVGDNSWAIVARFLSDGSIDTSFGARGIRSLGKGDDTRGNVVALQSDGKIILGGSDKDDTTTSAALFRLKKNGSIDTTFGTNGMAVLKAEDTSSLIRDMIVLTDNSVVITGYSVTDLEKNITTAKFLSEGTIDQTFGTKGFTVSSLENDSTGYSIAQKADGTFLIVGETLVGGNSDIAMIHLDKNGLPMSSTVLATAESTSQDESELIATESPAEPLLTDINSEDDFGRAVVVQSSGRVIAAGYSDNGRDDDFALLSFADDTEAATSSSSTSTSDPYLVATVSIANISRNGAVSGGVISKNKSYLCGSTTEDDCFPTVTARGVVYGVISYPVYRVSTDTTSTTTTTTTEDDNNSVFPDWVTNTSYNYDLVKTGQTSDGTGAGTYGSDIEEITPDSLYFVRAYAELTDSGGDVTILYGNQLTFETDDACFIATAAYGSILEGHVVALRQFRDRYLNTHDWGRNFVRHYYHLSPPIAELISQSTLLKYGVRLALLPLVSLSYLMLYTSLQAKILCILLAGMTFTLVKLLALRRHNEKL